MHVTTHGCDSVLARVRKCDCAGLRVHMIGVGGTGMRGAARVLADLGAQVTGSDIQAFDDLDALTAAGIKLCFGHSADLIDRGLDLVVTSAAIPERNCELAAARALEVPVLKYAELLGFLMQGRQGVAISGTHGKSTTTALTAWLLKSAGLSPTFVVGAGCPQMGGNGVAGKGPHFVVEACEFDRSFLRFLPQYAAILNIEPDHFDCYRNLDEIVEAFAGFAGNVRTGGALVYNADDVNCCRAAEGSVARRVSFGFCEGAEWRALNVRSEQGRFAFEMEHRGRPFLSATLQIAGRHNVANALAAAALAHEAGAGPEAIAAGLASFRGVDRRLSWRGEGRGVVVVDDYAHHPTEIRVTIEAVRCRYQPKRTWVIFQPHQYSRTEHLFEEFAGSFRQADEVIVPDVYAARETAERNGRTGSRELVSRIHDYGCHARYLPTLEEVTNHLAQHVTAGDLVLTMGAGDVWKVADALVARIREPS